MVEWEEPELIGVTQTEVAETTVRRGAGSRGKAIAALIAATFIGFLALQAFGALDEPIPDSAVNKITGEDAKPDNGDESGVTTSTTGLKPTSATTTPGQVVAGRPPFDHETGWDLLVGNDQMKLIRLSIDQGSHPVFARGYFPLRLIGDKLVVSSNSERLRWLPMSDLNATAQVLEGTLNQGYFYGRSSLAAGGTDTQVWIPGGVYEALTWQLWEFEGEPAIIRQIDSVPNRWGPPSFHPTILSASDGGVFRGERGSLERVADGKVIAVNDLHVIVEQCTTPFDCLTVWLHRDSFEPDTAVTPPPSSGSDNFLGMVTSADGKYVFMPSNRTGDGMIWNLQTGEIESEQFVDIVSFSPDSKYAAGPLRNGNIGVVDLKAGELAEWDLAGNYFYVGVLFVPAS